MFQSIGRRGNYANAGRVAADDLVRSFAAARRNSTDFGAIARGAATIRSNEKVQAIKRSEEVLKSGIAAASRVNTEKQKIAINETTSKSKRKAGALAAAGQLFGNAGQFMGEKRTKREVGSEDSYYDGRIKSLNDKAADYRGQAEAVDLTGGFTPMETPDLSTLTNTSKTSDTTKPTGTTTATSAVSTQSSSNDSLGSTASSTSGNLDYSSVVGLAKQAGAKYPQLVAAQWALESGWGKSPSGKNNYFGIKATGNEAGTSKQTWEVYGGKEVTETARFKDYDTPLAGVQDLVSKWHSDYKGYTGVNNAPDAYSAADMLRSQGYATDPAYAAKLKKIMKDQGY